MEGGIPPIERCPSDEHVVHTADVESPPPPPPNHDEAAALAAGVAEMSVNSSSAAAAPVVHFRREVATKEEKEKWDLSCPWETHEGKPIQWKGWRDEFLIAQRFMIDRSEQGQFFTISDVATVTVVENNWVLRNFEKEGRIFTCHDLRKYPKGSGSGKGGETLYFLRLVGETREAFSVRRKELTDPGPMDAFDRKLFFAQPKETSKKKSKD